MRPGAPDSALIVNTALLCIIIIILVNKIKARGTRSDRDTRTTGAREGGGAVGIESSVDDNMCLRTSRGSGQVGGYRPVSPARAPHPALWRRPAAASFVQAREVALRPAVFASTSYTTDKLGRRGRGTPVDAVYDRSLEIHATLTAQFECLNSIPVPFWVERHFAFHFDPNFDLGVDLHYSFSVDVVYIKRSATSDHKEVSAPSLRRGGGVSMAAAAACAERHRDAAFSCFTSQVQPRARRPRARSGPRTPPADTARLFLHFLIARK
ncbi:hypothetical protein EVAR_44448_1 [Eumeta japonica]|uniref:Uncharacterized protein n=1 Tax=Eumeta variegata TaxID=151549 RepID=A0A4C1WKB9_EUMVA|nr:hypothetical protein EVAR_44448_1 [Eumeta japonica]